MAAFKFANTQEQAKATYRPGLGTAEWETALKTVDTFRLETNLWKYLEQFIVLFDTVEARPLMG